MIKYLMVFVMLVGLNACTNPNDKNLGRHYFLWEINKDHYDLIYSDDENNADDGGLSIIDSEITEIGFNNDYIIAEDLNAGYWVIDKRVKMQLSDTDWKNKVLTGPMDVASFFKYLEKKNIQLKLVPVRPH